MITQLLAAAALVATQAQPAPAPTCVTREQAGDLLLVQLPDAVNTVAQTCSAQLPATAFLRTGATAYVERLRTEAAPRRASALAAFTLLGAGRIPQGVSPEAAMSGMTSGMLNMALSGRMNAAACAEADRFLQAFSALPGANLATMVSAGLGIAFAMRPVAPGAAAPRTYGPLCAS